MDFSRRGFLNLLGLGGLGVAAGVAISGPGSLVGPGAVPLFGSDEATALVVPEENVVAGHFVVYAKGRIEKVPEDEKRAYMERHGYGIPVARLTRNRDPGGAKLAMFPPRDGLLESRPVLAPGADPHVAFYQASLDMRDKFAAFSRETLLGVPQELRKVASLVTVVESAIYARPVGFREVYARQDRIDPEATGFDVSCRFRQFVRLADAAKGVETFVSYSDKGEFPINVPRAIDMTLLMKMDKEVVGQKVRAENAILHLTRTFSASPSPESRRQFLAALTT